MAFKKQMPPDARDQFVVRKDIFENCLVLYSIEDWDRQLERYAEGLIPTTVNITSFSGIFQGNKLN